MAAPIREQSQGRESAIRSRQEEKPFFASLRPQLNYLLSPFVGDGKTRTIRKPMLVILIAMVVTGLISVITEMFLLPLFEHPGTAAQFYKGMSSGLGSKEDAMLEWLHCLPTIACMLIGGLLMMLLRDRKPGTVMSVEGRFRWKRIIDAWPALVPLVGVFVTSVWEWRDGLTLANIDLVPMLVFLLPMGLTIAFEDILWRGYLRQTLFAWVGNRKAFVGSLGGQRVAMFVSTVIASAMFASLHPYDVWGVLSAAVFGLLSCWLTDVTDGIETPITVHVLYDLTLLFVGAVIPGQAAGGVAGSLTISLMEVLTDVLCVVPVVLWCTRKRRDGRGEQADEIQVSFPDMGDRRPAGHVVVPVLACALSGAFLVFCGISAMSIHMETDSLEPVIHSGDLLLHGDYQDSYEEGDIVSVYWEEDPEMHYVYIRQIQGVPGDTVEVDGKEVTLGDEEYLVGSTNHESSKGRLCDGVVVSFHDIDGKIAYRLLPVLEPIE